MFQKDYIMRMIEQFTTALATIIGLKSADKIEEQQLVVNKALYDFTGLSEAAMETLSYKDLISLVSGFKEINPVKCYIMAELMKEKADVYERLGETDQAYNLYLKSFNIYVEVVLLNKSSELEPNYKTIDQTIHKITQFPLPYETQKLRLYYYEQTMKYDKAEDILFELLAEGGDKKTVLAEGNAFYERLLKKKPEELKKGNLPIDEVLESIQKLQGF
ncbi:MAG TPA: hypothetical protein DD730_05100 [Desulfosporosinus sp.]|jgi:tetratricopeptide (TPR) repeat protein|nr:hypothetical protein [Desulfosporosinus sp.]